jgi:hypothetical protein
VKDIETIIHGNMRQAYSASLLSAMRAEGDASVREGNSCYQVYVGNDLRQVHQYINSHE